jgi:hypothetical protein
LESQVTIDRLIEISTTPYMPALVYHVYILPKPSRPFYFVTIDAVIDYRRLTIVQR